MSTSPDVSLLPSERLAQELTPHVRKAVKSAALGWLVTKLLWAIVPMLVRWAIEILIAMYGDAALKLVRPARQMFEAYLNEEGKLAFQAVEELAAQSAVTFDRPVQRVLNDVPLVVVRWTDATRRE
jgi:hypothetical protein